MPATVRLREWRARPGTRSRRPAPPLPPAPRPSRRRRPPAAGPAQLSGTTTTLGITIGVGVASNGDVWVATFTTTDQLYQFNATGACLGKWTLRSGTSARGMVLDPGTGSAFMLFSGMAAGTTTIDKFSLSSREPAAARVTGARARARARAAGPGGRSRVPALPAVPAARPRAVAAAQRAPPSRARPPACPCAAACRSDLPHHGPERRHVGRLRLRQPLVLPVSSARPGPLALQACSLGADGADSWRPAPHGARHARIPTDPRSRRPARPPPRPAGAPPPPHPPCRYGLGIDRTRQWVLAGPGTGKPGVLRTTFAGTTTTLSMGGATASTWCARVAAWASPALPALPPCRAGAAAASRRQPLAAAGLRAQAQRVARQSPAPRRSACLPPPCTAQVRRGERFGQPRDGAAGGQRARAGA